MKAKIISLAAILVISVTAVFAKSPQSDLQQTIKSQIVYPEYLIEKNIQGTVFVEFMVTEAGKIEVLNSNSFSGDLMEYVVMKISSINVPSNPELNNQKFLMRFDFKLE